MDSKTTLKIGKIGECEIKSKLRWKRRVLVLTRDDGGVYYMKSKDSVTSKLFCPLVACKVMKLDDEAITAEERNKISNSRSNTTLVFVFFDVSDSQSNNNNNNNNNDGNNSSINSKGYVSFATVQLRNEWFEAISVAMNKDHKQTKIEEIELSSISSNTTITITATTSTSTASVTSNSNNELGLLSRVVYVVWTSAVNVGYIRNYIRNKIAPETQQLLEAILNFTKIMNGDDLSSKHEKYIYTMAMHAALLSAQGSLKLDSPSILILGEQARKFVKLYLQIYKKTKNYDDVDVDIDSLSQSQDLKEIQEIGIRTTKEVMTMLSIGENDDSDGKSYERKVMKEISSYYGNTKNLSSLFLDSRVKESRDTIASSFSSDALAALNE